MLRVRAERLKRNLRQSALALLSRLPSGRVSEIETGRRRPYDHELAKLASALGVSPPESLLDVVSFEPATSTNEALSARANTALVRWLGTSALLPADLRARWQAKKNPRYELGTIKGVGTETIAEILHYAFEGDREAISREEQRGYRG